MLKFLTPNNKTTLKSYIALLGLVLAAVMILSSPAYAGPQEKQEDPIESIDKAVDENKDTADENKPVKLPETDNTGDYVPEPVMPEPTMDDTKSALDKAQSCFKQDSGAYECICEGEKACADLTKSQICEAGTEWKNEEGFGGCTKKKE
ncbi:MAG: hypothetical protein JKY25_11225 [Robiginitomaculum sp.]|nr:hypothetical protein [Robiginitomaculum sp.]